MKKHIMFILTIMLVVCLGGCSFSLGGNNENNTPVDNTSNTNDTNVNMQFYEAAQKMIVKDLFNVISIGSCGDSGYNYDFSNKTKITVDDLKDEEKYAMTYNNMVKNYNDMSIDVNSVLKSFSKNSFAKSYRNLFGIEPVLPNEINIHRLFAKYTLGDHPFYEHSLIISGCEGPIKNSSLLSDYEINNEFLSFYVINYIEDNRLINEAKKYITVSLQDDSFKFETTDGMTTEEIETKVKENKDKFTQYKFNFKLSDDHYIFDSIEKIN